jgi:hypothetical protein
MSTLESELVALERRYWKAIADRDLGAMERLTEDPCVVTGASGVGVIDKRRFREMMKSPSWRLNRFEITDTHALELRPDVAVLAYKVHEELTVDGEEVSFDAADSSIWVRLNGRWVCAVHTESIAGDPFGRDRTKRRDHEAVARRA